MQRIYRFDYLSNRLLLVEWWEHPFTLVLNESTTDAALPVQLIRIKPKQRAGCANPKRANVFAPAPSPSPMTYFTCKKSNTVTKSSPSVFSDGKTKLCQHKNAKKKRLKLSKHIKLMINYRWMTYESGSLSALSAWPGTSMWMKHERSFISVIHGLFTNSWNDVSTLRKVFSLQKIAHKIDCQMKQDNFSW